MSTTKHDVELRKYDYKTTVFERACTLIKNLMWAFCVCFVFYYFHKMVVAVSQGQPGQISAVAKMVRELSIDRVLLILTNVITGAGLYNSRRRNNRLTEKLGDKRHKIEENDIVNTRSGLDKYGHRKGE